MEEFLKYPLSLVQEKNNGKRRFTMLMRRACFKRTLVKIIYNRNGISDEQGEAAQQTELGKGFSV